MHFKSCIRCLRVGMEGDGMWDDGVVEGSFLVSVLPLPLLIEAASEEDEPLRLTEEFED